MRGLGACAVLLLVTSSGLPIVWDEGDTIQRAEQIASLAPRDWPYTTQREGHPPLAGIVIALGRSIAPAWLDPLTQFRLGPILLFSLAAGAMFYRLQRDYRVWVVSLTAVAALVTMPRLFAHAHFATLDGPLTACWILAWAAFATGLPRLAMDRHVRRGARPDALREVHRLAGGASLSRLDGSVSRPRRRCVRYCWACRSPWPFLLLLNPPLWDQPLAGLRDVLRLESESRRSPVA